MARQRLSGGLGGQTLVRVTIDGNNAREAERWDMAPVSAKWSKARTVRSTCWRTSGTDRAGGC
jgi:hypothetical protein